MSLTAGNVCEMKIILVSPRGHWRLSIWAVADSRIVQALRTLSSAYAALPAEPSLCSLSPPPFLEIITQIPCRSGLQLDAALFLRPSRDERALPVKIILPSRHDEYASAVLATLSFAASLTLFKAGDHTFACLATKVFPLPGGRILPEHPLILRSPPLPEISEANIKRKPREFADVDAPFC